MYKSYDNDLSLSHDKNALNTEYEIPVWDPSSWSCKLIYSHSRG